MYEWFTNLISAPQNADSFIVTLCGVTCVLGVCIAFKAVLQVIDYMVGGRKK